MDLEPVRTGSEIFIQNYFRESAKPQVFLGNWLLMIEPSEANIQRCPLKPIGITIEIHYLRPVL
jgi:hypothetical protein